MDLIGLPMSQAGYKHVLTMTDYYTKFVDFFPLKDKCVSSFAQGIKTFVNRWIAPKRLLSDQGRDFVCQVSPSSISVFAAE